MIEKLRINIQDTEHVTNVYIVWDEMSQEAVLIDPADKEYIILRVIEEKGLKLKYVLLTHGHKDHTVALPDIMEKYPDVTVTVEFTGSSAGLESLAAGSVDIGAEFSTDSCRNMMFFKYFHEIVNCFL